MTPRRRLAFIVLAAVMVVGFGIAPDASARAGAVHTGETRVAAHAVRAVTGIPTHADRRGQPDPGWAPTCATATSDWVRALPPSPLFVDSVDPPADGRSRAPPV